jgi:hypothetical protein
MVVVLRRGPAYFSAMRGSSMVLASFCWLAFMLAAPARAATGQVLKVLPHFLDQKGRHTLSPSLYERDAYQAHLREHPEERAGIRFDVQWKTKGSSLGTFRLILEAHTIVGGNQPRQIVLEKKIEPSGLLSRWTGLVVTGEKYPKFGEVTAWRVTLWEDDDLLGEQKSFLW